jgi:hypothetical protein
MRRLLPIVALVFDEPAPVGVDRSGIASPGGAHDRAAAFNGPKLRKSGEGSGHDAGLITGFIANGDQKIGRSGWDQRLADVRADGRGDLEAASRHNGPFAWRGRESRRGLFYLLYLAGSQRRMLRGRMVHRLACAAPLPIRRRPNFFDGACSSHYHLGMRP